MISLTGKEIRPKAFKPNQEDISIMFVSTSMGTKT